MTRALDKQTDLASSRLAACEETIEQGLETFVDVGNALLLIREEGLYENAGFKTFEDYCEGRWHMSKRHANRLVAAAEVAQRVGPIGPKPATESQARPLAALPEEEQADAWREAVESAPDGKVTAKHVQEVVDRRTGEVINASELAVLKPLRTGERKSVSCAALRVAGETLDSIHAMTEKPWSQVSSIELKQLVKKLRDVMSGLLA